MQRQASVTTFPIFCLAVLISVEAHAKWNGIGVSTGTGGSNLCATVNWIGGTIDGDLTSINTAGAYTLIMSADLDRSAGMDFSCPVDGVQLIICSDSEGTPRTLKAGSLFRIGKPTVTTANTVTFSKDVRLNVVSLLTIARSSELTTGATLVPTCTINGPLAFSVGGGLKHTGGSLTLNGCVSGPGSLMLGGNTGADVYTTLTCSTNTFSGGLLWQATKMAYLTVAASTVLANEGQPSALGSGGPICFPANNTANGGITFSGFSTPQTTDRVFVLTSTYPYLYNNGTAPLRLTGAITNIATSSYLYLGGSYNSHSSPNIISGPILQQSPSNVIVPRIIGNGIWRMTNPANTFTGKIAIGNDGKVEQGIQFNSANALGLNSSLMISLPLNSANNYFTFLGDSECLLSKEIIIEGYYSSAVNNFIANGTEKLTLAGNIYQTPAYNSVGAFRALAFGGMGEGVFTGMTWLTNQFAVKSDLLQTYSIDIRKRGTGSWRFAGEHLNHEGSTRIDAGNLIFDYTTHNQMTAPTNKISLNEGTLTFRGAPGGATEEALNTLTLSELGYQFNTLALDANGGSGVHLAFGTLAAANGALTQQAHLFDLSSSSGNTLTVNSLASLSVVNNLLMRGGRAIFLTKTVDGVSLATWNSADGRIVPFSAYDAYPGANSGTENFLFTSDITRTGTESLYFSTITADSSANGVTVDIGGLRFFNLDKGRAILARGTHDVTFRTSSEEGGHVVWFHNYLTNGAALMLDLKFGTTNYWYTDGSGALTFSGPGLTVVTKAGLGTQPTLAEGTLRSTLAQTLAPTYSLTLTAGGVLEIGADLNGAGAGDFSLTCGVASAGVFLRSEAGFSAYGADRTVNLGGAGATLSWGTNGFLNNVAGEDHGFALKLSSPYANAKIDFQNPIALNACNSPYGFRRTVEVADGSAAIDAQLSGALDGDSELVKTGAGTLMVSAGQNYRALRVKAGGLIAATGCFAASNAIPVTLASATLGGTAGSSNSFGTLTLTGDCVLDVADGTAAMSFADSSQADWGAATLTLRGELADNKLRFGTSGAGLTAAQVASITAPNATVKMAADGYIRLLPKGTLIKIQ